MGKAISPVLIRSCELSHVSAFAIKQLTER
jgi:hypothetical protein